MGSGLQLERLRLRSFRGATKEVPILFDATKRITMLFGENGTGKSTVVDALTFLCDQSIGSLDDRASAKDPKFLVSAGAKKNDVLVEVKAAGGTWIASFAGKNIQVSPTIGHPNLQVLRRPQLLQFIDAEPKKRYEKLKQFISTPGIESSESSLREAVRAEGVVVDNASRDLAGSDTDLRELWEKAGKPSTDVKRWADGIAQQNVTHLRAQNEALRKVDDLGRTLKGAIDRALLEQGRTKGAEDAFQKALVAQRDEEGKTTAQATDLIQLLTVARDYIGKKSALSACPVCDQTVDRGVLHAGLCQKIATFDNLSKAVTTSRAHKEKLETAHNLVQVAVQGLRDAFQELAKHIAQSGLPAYILPKFDDGDVGKLANGEVSDRDSVVAAQSIHASIETGREPRKVLAEKNDQTIALQTAVKVQLDKSEKLKGERAKTNDLFTALSRALQVVEEERKTFVSGVLTAISTDVSALYESLHPNERLGNVSLLLDTKYQGSLHVHADFCAEKDIPPQAYFSESHLDTLGLCIFLAFAKKFSPPNTLVILDDVLTSVDSAHLDRFIDLVDSEAHGFGHVIITTHYRPWRDRYRMHQAASSKLHFIELKEWAADRGLLPDTCKPAIHELQDWLDPKKFDRQIVASKGGILLESMLDHLSLLYKVRLPRKPAQDYTLGEFLDGFSKKDRALLRVEHIGGAGEVVGTDLGPIIDALGGMAWIRNQVGCHFSLSGETVSDKDVRAFGEKVVELGKALACSEGGDFPKKNKSGSYFESRHGRCRLHPLQLP
jgi:energy-coupling factor transporter ATP-binding protein EcfA2